MNGENLTFIMYAMINGSNDNFKMGNYELLLFNADMTNLPLRSSKIQTLM